MNNFYWSTSSCRTNYLYLHTFLILCFGDRTLCNFWDRENWKTPTEHIVLFAKEKGVRGLAATKRSTTGLCQVRRKSQKTWKQKWSATQRKAAERHLNFWTSLISRRVWPRKVPEMVRNRYRAEGQEAKLKGRLWNWKHFPSLKALSGGNQLIAARSQAMICPSLMPIVFKEGRQGSAIFFIITFNWVLLASLPRYPFRRWPGVY